MFTDYINIPTKEVIEKYDDYKYAYKDFGLGFIEKFHLTSIIVQIVYERFAYALWFLWFQSTSYKMGRW